MYYQCSIETVETRKTGIPARFATLTREKWEKQIGYVNAKMVLDMGHTLHLPNGTTITLHSKGS